MADNILTKDRADADIDLAAKQIATVLYPRNIITDPAGTDLTPLTDTALRAAPVPVSGTVAVTGAFWQATQPVSFTWAGLTDAELRATAVPVSLASVPSHAVTNAGTFAVQAAQSGSWTVTANAGSGTFAVSAASLPLPSGAATEGTLDARTGALTETAPASDTASSGINGRLQRIAQRITSLITAIGTPLQAGGDIGNIAGTVSLPTGAATETTLAAASAKLPASLGAKAGAASLSVVAATPTTVTIVSLQTNATGTTYNAFASQACQMLDIVNTQPAAVDLEVRRGGSGNTIIVPAGSSRMFVGLSNASGLQVRRRDTSNEQVTFTAEAIAQ